MLAYSAHGPFLIIETTLAIIFKKVDKIAVPYPSRDTSLRLVDDIDNTSINMNGMNVRPIKCSQLWGK